MKNTMLFLGQWVAAPLRTAAVAPSSRSLARLMTQDITPQTGPVIELGPGTGAFTAALCERGITEGNLTLIELNPKFAELLRHRFPAARVLQMNAADLGTISALPGNGTGAVLSGLGLPSMPSRQVTDILRGSFQCLKSGGAFYQFTYGPRCPITPGILVRLGLKAERVGGTLFNLPPASVYRITRLAD